MKYTSGAKTIDSPIAVIFLYFTAILLLFLKVQLKMKNKKIAINRIISTTIIVY